MERARAARRSGAPRPPAVRKLEAAAAAPTLDENQYAALAQFRYALRAFLAFSEAATSSSGITSQQYQALLAIKTHPGGTVLIRDLAEQMLLRHNGAVQLVDRLVQSNLVRRDTSKSDRRAVVLSLTAKGEAKVAYLAALHFRELVRRQSQLTDISRLASRMDTTR